MIVGFELIRPTRLRDGFLEQTKLGQAIAQPDGIDGQIGERGFRRSIELARTLVISFIQEMVASLVNDEWQVQLIRRQGRQRPEGYSATCSVSRRIEVLGPEDVGITPRLLWQSLQVPPR